MSNTKFTKGVWDWSHDECTSSMIQIDSDIGCSICRLQSEDDAQLIAAAPEMYAALTLARLTLSNVWKNTGSLGCKAEIESIDETLAKARGES